MSNIFLLIIKDLKIQFRSRELLTQMIFLGLLLIMILSFAFGPQFSEPQNVAAGSLWLALSFVSVINLHRSFSIEREGGTIKALLLTGIDPGKFFLSKFLSSFILLNLAAVIFVPASLIAFNVITFSLIPPLLIIVLLGTAGFGAVGVVLAAMDASSNAHEYFLTIILFPLIMPVIIFAVKATRMLLISGDVSQAYSVLVWLSAYDVFFLVLSYFLFGQVLEE